MSSSAGLQRPSGSTWPSRAGVVDIGLEARHTRAEKPARGDRAIRHRRCWRATPGRPAYPASRTIEMISALSGEDRGRADLRGRLVRGGPRCCGLGRGCFGRGGFGLRGRGQTPRGCNGRHGVRRGGIPPSAGAARWAAGRRNWSERFPAPVDPVAPRSGIAARRRVTGLSRQVALGVGLRVGDRVIAGINVTVARVSAPGGKRQPTRLDAHHDRRSAQRRLACRPGTQSGAPVRAIASSLATGQPGQRGGDGAGAGSAGSVLPRSQMNKPGSADAQAQYDRGARFGWTTPCP